MKRIFVFPTGILLILLVFSGSPAPEKTRQPIDPIGFATRAWQMDSTMARIQRLQGKKLSQSWERNQVEKFTQWKVAICPHDDYAYVGWLYPSVLRNIKASTVILLGVAHKAKKYGIEGKMVFDSYDSWRSAYGSVRVSSLREKITNSLPRSAYLINDSLHQAEHSLEAIIPFLQYYNKDIRIVPILVPAMSFDRMDGLSNAFSLALMKVLQSETLDWSKDVAIVISSDAVHYGDDGWGGQNYAPYGCDSSGYSQAIAHEYEIISNCLTGEITKDKIRRFAGYTVQDTNYRTYKWTWCGRYSVPFGLLTSYYLQQKLLTNPAKGVLLGYSSSINQPPIPVEDLKMGTTAIASLRHWVGYVAIGYR